MHTVSLRKVGGSIMLTLPPPLLRVLNLSPGAKVRLSIENGRLVIEPQREPRYTLQELLAQCDPSAEKSAEDEAWLSGRGVGGELL